GGLVYTGLESVSWNSNIGFSKNLSAIIGSADSYKALLWSSISGVTVAVVLTLSQGLLSLQQSIESLINGFKTMITAILILILAWSLAKLTEDLHTADFITKLLVSIEMKPVFIPALTFIIAVLVAFSTGSSWSTMAILYPLILPASWLLSKESGLDHDSSMKIFYNVVSTVLAGSVLGDHCSPISDTTILSSLASSCKHIDHVKTQLPYALTVGGISLVFGTLLSSYNIPSWILFILGIVILFLIIRFIGKKTPEPVSEC
ncbi:MAG: Na+/H+ antiporter NhaC family protein, partial [Bacteroidota bacterium]|nr:Na+/H+ antiporter NhaC family protein [Bacteroidota bacterium]